MTRAFSSQSGRFRLISLTASTGAPICSIAVAALRQNGARMVIIAGGHGIESLYMIPARPLICFNDHIVPSAARRRHEQSE
jgi:hypothetical protein